MRPQRFLTGGMGADDDSGSGDRRELARALVQATLSRLCVDESPLMLRVMATIAAHLPHLPTADDVAEEVGQVSRFALARELKAAGLPPFVQLRGRVWALFCLARHHVGGDALERQAFEDGREPSGYYSRMREVTGETWNEFKRRRLSGGFRVIRGEGE